LTIGLCSGAIRGAGGREGGQEGRTRRQLWLILIFTGNEKGVCNALGIVFAKHNVHLATQ